MYMNVYIYMVIHINYKYANLATLLHRFPSLISVSFWGYPLVELGDSPAMSNMAPEGESSDI
jgi:hypothetical protein